MILYRSSFFSSDTSPSISLRIANLNKVLLKCPRASNKTRELRKARHGYVGYASNSIRSMCYFPKSFEKNLPVYYHHMHLEHRLIFDLMT